MLVTVAELAAFLGLSTSRVRHIIADAGIEPAGQRWKANLYRAGDVLRHTGSSDRLAKVT